MATGRALYRPADLERDQSYFLFATTREQLAFLRFPLGPMTKAETRAAAREFGAAGRREARQPGHLLRAVRPLCRRDPRLKPGRRSRAGEIVHIDGRVLGRHDGIINFTVGQRRGIGVAIGEPLYVVHLDPASRRVIVGPRDALATRRLHLRAVNWLGDGEIDGLAADGIDIFARVRSTRPPMPARLFHRDGRVHVDLAGAEAGVAPGQACVFYDGDGAGARVLGGGFIERSEHDRQGGTRPAEARRPRSLP